MADGRVSIDVMVDDSGVGGKIDGIDNRFKGMGNTADQSKLSIGKVIGALGGFMLARKGIDMVKQSIAGAFQRIDTMEQFNRVMGVMGHSPKVVSKALDDMTKYVTGTSYTLDGAAHAVQGFVTRGMEVSKATKTIATWGDAVALYGDGSQEQFGAVTTSLQKMISSGKVGMQDYEAIMNAGIPAIEYYAEATGMSIAEVKKALSDGSIDAETFIDVVTKAMITGTETWASVEGSAAAAGMTWSAVFTNMGTRAAAGMVDIIQALDTLLTDNNIPEMRVLLDMLGTNIMVAFKKVAQAIPVVLQPIMQVIAALKPFAPLLKVIAIAVGVFIGVFVGIAAIAGTFSALGGAIAAVWGILMANPVAIVIGLLAALIVGGIKLVQNWESIKAKALAVFPFLAPLFITLQAAFVGMAERVKSVVESLGIKWGSFGSMFAQVKEKIVTVIMAIAEKFSGFGTKFQSVKDKVMQVVQAFTPMFAQFRDSIMQSLESVGPALESFKNLWTALQPILMLVVQVIGGALVLAFGILMGAINGVALAIGPFIETIAAIGSVIANMVALVFNLIMGDWAAAWDNVIAIADGVWDALNGLVMTVFNLIGGFVQGIFDFFYGLYMALVGGSVIPDMVNAIVDWFMNMVNWVVDIVMGFVDAVVAGFMFVVNGVLLVMNLLWTGIQVAWNAIVLIFTTVVTIITTIVQAGFTILSTIVQGVMLVVQTVIQTAWAVIQTIITTVVTVIQTIVTTAFTVIQTIIQGVMLVIQAVIKGAWAIIKTIFSTVLAVIKAVVTGNFSAIPGIITAGMNRIKSIITLVWNVVKRVFSTVLNTVKSIVSNAWSNIKSVISSGMSRIKAVISSAWNFIKGIVSKVLNSIKSTISNVWTFISNYIKVTMSRIKSTISSIWNSIKSVITSAVNKVKSVVTSVFNSIKSKISSVMSSIKSKISSVWNAIKSTISSVMNSIKSKISSIWNSIKSTITSKVNAIKSKVRSVFNALKGIVTSAMSRVKSAVRTGITAAYRVVTGIAGKMYSAGRNMIQAIGRGIKNAAGAVKKKMKNLVGSLRDMLPFSPAKEGPLKDIMKTRIGESIAETIERGTPSAIKSMGKLAQGIQDEAESDIGFELDPKISSVAIKGMDKLKGRTAEQLIGLNEEVIFESNLDHVINKNMNIRAMIEQNKQPAVINLTLGGSEFESFVDDIVEVQERNTLIKKSFRG